MDEPMDSRFVDEITNAQPKLRAYIVKLLANSSSTDDVLQEANRVLWLKRDQWDPTTNFLKWAYRVSCFQAKAFLRDFGRDKLVFREELIEQLASEKPRETRPALLEEALKGCLKRLEESRCSRVLRHYDPNEWSNEAGNPDYREEIARHRGLLPKPVKPTPAKGREKK